MIAVSRLLSLTVVVLLAHYAYIVPDLFLSIMGGVFSSLLLFGNIASLIQNKG